MPVPPPLPDPAHIEARVIALAEILDRAVDAVQRIMDELREPDRDTHRPTGEITNRPPTEAGSADD